MEKNTVLAIVLSVAVIVVFTVVQGIFFAPKHPAAAQPRQEPVSSAAPTQPAYPPVPELQAPVESGSLQAAETQKPPLETGPYAADLSAGMIELGDREPVVIETEVMIVTFSRAGGDIVSWKLKDHKDKDGMVDMILSGSKEARAFTVAFGGLNAQPVTAVFDVKKSDYSVEFSQNFIVPSGLYGSQDASFRLVKRYDFRPGDYLFQMTILLDGGYSVPGFNFNGSAYTLSFGPQIGPQFVKLDNRYDYRQYITYANGKRKMEKANDSIMSSKVDWAAISGKYFAFVAMPLLVQYDFNFSEKREDGIPSASRYNIIRPAYNGPRVEDTYRFYLGPKSQEILNTYNTGENGFGLSGLKLVEVANTRGILSPLEKALKWLLILFYKMVPNYGVAIILLTLLVKILFFPLTKKSSEATLRMQAVAPKIKELQEKYKDDRQKMNTAMAELYKKEGYNPLSGCLPMLLQIPIFFAMYNLFNNHFDLRNAVFIPGWIPDLSLPESVWNFPEGVKLPLLGWTALRLLPFIYVGSQLIYGKVTQIPGQQSNAQMKMMLYIMPIVFFFILYDVPSGLLIYWIFSNVLTMVQQVAINKYLAPKRAAAKAAEEAAAAAAAAQPKKKKK